MNVENINRFVAYWNQMAEQGVVPYCEYSDRLLIFIDNIQGTLVGRLTPYYIIPIIKVRINDVTDQNILDFDSQALYRIEQSILYSLSRSL